MMRMLSKAKYLLLSRYGSTEMRTKCFDSKYRECEWSFNQRDEELLTILARLGRRKRALMLGCGQAAIASDLVPTVFDSLTGVDLSVAAVESARQQHPKTGITFEVGNMESWPGEGTYDAIIFSESIYYTPFWKRKRMLRYWKEKLSSDGVFVVTISQSQRYRGILTMIRQGFEVSQDFQSEKGQRWFIIFR
jgi:trans-aconitate methyltransferase